MEKISAYLVAMITLQHVLVCGQNEFIVPPNSAILGQAPPPQQYNHRRISYTDLGDAGASSEEGTTRQHALSGTPPPQESEEN